MTKQFWKRKRQNGNNDGWLELSSLEKTMRYHVEREFESHLPKLVRLDLKLFYIIITNYVNKSPTCVLIGFSNKYLCWHRVTGQNFYGDKWHMLKISRNTILNSRHKYFHFQYALWKFKADFFVFIDEHASRAMPSNCVSQNKVIHTFYILAHNFWIDWAIDT